MVTFPPNMPSISCSTCEAAARRLLNDNQCSIKLVGDGSLYILSTNRSFNYVKRELPANWSVKTIILGDGQEAPHQFHLKVHNIDPFFD